MIMIFGGFLLGWFWQDSRLCKARIKKLEKAGEDLSCAAWSVGSDLEDNYDPDTINNDMGRKLVKASERWHEITFREPIKPAKK